jgi:crotonobetainyl-CoA:carnitine CoA-transferase CaiB-like acyl-CoA transferase
MLPAVAVRRAPTAPPAVAWPASRPRLDGARVVVLGAMWAAPLAGLVLAELGADVVHVTHPSRLDAFPLREALVRGQREHRLDLDEPAGRDGFAALLAGADLLVDGTTPRVLDNAGLPDPLVPVVRIAAFRGEDRPGYGIAAECRGGWAARHDPPRVGRTSGADPVAGLLAAIAAVDVLACGTARSRVRVTLEDAVGFLFAVEGVDG